MSSDAQPITPTRFAAALPSLPISSLHAKAAELLNSLSHLQASNTQLLPFADPSDTSTFDAVCAESIRENLVVMQSMKERLEILRGEVEGRGGRWVWGGLAEEVGAGSGAVEGENADGRMNGEPENLAGQAEGARREQAARSDATVNGVLEGSTYDSSAQQDSARSGRFTDEELARRMAERMQEDDEDDPSEGGLHL